MNTIASDFMPGVPGTYKGVPAGRHDCRLKKQKWRSSKCRQFK